MWKREESGGFAESSTHRGPGPGPPSSGGAAQHANKAGRSEHRSSGAGLDAVSIGKSVIVKGELSGNEDMTIEGRIEGKVDLHQHVLTIGPNAKLNAQIAAKTVVVIGEVKGNITASDKITIREQGSVDGDVSAPRVAIAEGAHFRGSIDMQQRTRPAAAAKPVDAAGAAKGVAPPRVAAAAPVAGPVAGVPKQ